VANGHFVTKPLGSGKATKFVRIESVTTSSKSVKILRTFSDRGLKSDALRAAIIGFLYSETRKMSRYDVAQDATLITPALAFSEQGRPDKTGRT
jgi:hypothetical protein